MQRIESRVERDERGQDLFESTTLRRGQRSTLLNLSARSFLVAAAAATAKLQTAVRAARGPTCVVGSSSQIWTSYASRYLGDLVSKNPGKGSCLCHTPWATNASSQWSHRACTDVRNEPCCLDNGKGHQEVRVTADSAFLGGWMISRANQARARQGNAGTSCQTLREEADGKAGPQARAARCACLQRPRAHGVKPQLAYAAISVDRRSPHGQPVRASELRMVPLR